MEQGPARQRTSIASSAKRRSRGKNTSSQKAKRGAGADAGRHRGRGQNRQSLRCSRFRSHICRCGKFSSSPTRRSPFHLPFRLAADRASITGGVCSAYGLSTWGHLFTSRQLMAMLTVTQLVQAVRDDVRSDALAAGVAPHTVDAYAQTVVTFLGLVVDRCADFNNALCRWSPSNQKVMNLFARQAIPMVWDFAEANILGDSVGAWHTCCEHVADCVEVVAAGTHHQGQGARLMQPRARMGFPTFSPAPIHHTTTTSATPRSRISSTSGSAEQWATCIQIRSAPS